MNILCYKVNMDCGFKKPLVAWHYLRVSWGLAQDLTVSSLKCLLH